MPANIKNNDSLRYNLHLINDRYYDYMLFKGECEEDTPDCVAADIDFGKIEDNKVMSSIIWDGAMNKGLEMNNIGLTGVDNGFISFEKDRITNRDFIELYTNSEFSLPTKINENGEEEDGDRRFFMTKVDGNTQKYSYPMDVEDGYTALKGGFYQGFFKVYGQKYQTLPSFIKSDWTLSFTLRKKDYEIPENAINNKYKENDGIFFYIGTRAENKFSFDYSGLNVTPKLNGKMIVKESSIEFVPTKEIGKGIKTGDSVFVKTETDSFYAKVVIEDDRYWLVVKYKEIPIGEYDNVVIEQQDVTDSYMYTYSDGHTKYNDFDEDNYFTDEFTDAEYLGKDIDLETVKVLTSEGHELDERGYYKIETDNKFLLFNHTENGFTTETWDKDADIVLTGQTYDNNENLFITMNHTDTGYTTETIEKHIIENQKPYDIYNDIRDNSFALRMIPKLNADGDIEGYNIGYKYGITDCKVEETNYSVVEEQSDMKKEFLIKKDEWADIDVRFSIVGPRIDDECDKRLGTRKMKIYIYVNGNLVFVSKELPEFRFRKLNDVAEKQEGVPYNISVGGGTQGLADMIWKEYYKTTDIVYPLEKNFAGSFIGDIKNFKFNECSLNHTDINKKYNICN